MNALTRPSTPAATTAAASQAHPLDLAALVGPAGWNRLSPAIRRRFAAAHADVTYQGSMTLQRSAIGRCFALLACFLSSPLVAKAQTDVPVQVRVSGNGTGGVVWERHLRLAGQARAQVVRSTKLCGPRGGLEERTDGGLSMALDVVEENGALVFYSRRYFLALGSLCLPIPAWLTPGRCRVEHRDEGPGQFRFTLDMVHPVWGCTFHQTGVFTDPEESPS